jgi:hypothetical protein
MWNQVLPAVFVNFVAYRDLLYKEGLLVKVGYKITRQDVVKIELSRAEVTLNSNPFLLKTNIQP